jgi:hypothetical protein
MSDDIDRELAELLAERREANPRKTPDREPVGGEQVRRLIGVTSAAIVTATLVLLLVLLLG